MKKVLYVVIMAMAVSLTSCSWLFGGKGSEPKADTESVKEPEIDAKAGTVNGVKYNTEDYKCWLLEWSYEYSYSVVGLGEQKLGGDKGSKYLWATEFQAQVAKAEADYAGATSQKYSVDVPGASISAKISSSLTEQKDKDVNNCESDK